ncbi:hypothetical protein HYW20_08400 [Candidatus Woesearchaeota archaeon]|nr:hypothetical protein [Candidatus Woesearchaeota archaeon]
MIPTKNSANLTMSQSIFGNTYLKAVLFISLVIIVLITINSIYKNAVLVAPQQTNWSTLFGARELDVAFFGSSHTETDINPAYIPNSYNFGSSGLNYKNVFYRLSLLKENGLKMHTVVFEISMPIFTSALSDDIKPLDVNLIEALNKNNTELNNFTSARKACFSANESPTEKIARCMPVVGHGANFFLANQSRSMQQGELGWVNLTGDFSRYSEKERMDMARNLRFFRERSSKQFYDTTPRNSSWHFFLKSMELAKDESRIVLIIYPVSKEFEMDLRQLNISKKKYYEYILRQTRASGVDYVLLDYYELFFDSPEYFDNPSHLNIDGSTIFSKRLENDLEKHFIIP